MVGPQRALVVDDEPTIAATVRMAVESLGWDVATAGSGEAALAQLAAVSFGLVLLDLKLPGIQGLDVLRQIAADSPGMKVVVMSAYITPELALEAIRLGAADILRKPFSPGELRAAITGVMDRESRPGERDRRFQDDLVSARAHLLDQRVPACVEIAGHAIALRPDRPEGYNLLGVCHELLGEEAEAGKMYRLALEADSDYAPSRSNLDRLIFGRRRHGPADLG